MVAKIRLFWNLTKYGWLWFLLGALSTMLSSYDKLIKGLWFNGETIPPLWFISSKVLGIMAFIELAFFALVIIVFISKRLVRRATKEGYIQA